MKLYEITTLTHISGNPLVAITTKTGYNACCPADRMYELYTNSESETKMKSHGNINSIVFYDGIDFKTKAFPLESDDWSLGLNITPSDFTAILKYTIHGKYNGPSYKYSVNKNNEIEIDHRMCNELRKHLNKANPRRYNKNVTTEYLYFNLIDIDCNLHDTVKLYLDTLYDKNIPQSLFGWLLHIWSTVV